MPDFLESHKLAHPYVRVHSDALSLHFENECIQSLMSCRNPDGLDIPYTKTMMVFLLAKPNPDHILMIGLGGGSLAKFCHKHLPNTRITVVEINPDVIALRNLFKVPDDDDRFRVVLADGADFVRDAKTNFDVILVDGFDEKGQSAQLTTREFYEDCYRLLQTKGILVANLDNEHPLHILFLRRALKAFMNCVVELQVPERSNSILFAGKNLLITSRWMSLSWTLNGHTSDAKHQLKDEFQRILGILDTLEPLTDFSGSQASSLSQ